MAKKPQTPTNSEAQQRQSRKELLIARKRERQVRNLRIAGVLQLRPGTRSQLVGLLAEQVA